MNESAQIAKSIRDLKDRLASFLRGEYARTEREFNKAVQAVEYFSLRIKSAKENKLLFQKHGDKFVQAFKTCNFSNYDTPLSAHDIEALLHRVKTGNHRDDGSVSSSMEGYGGVNHTIEQQELRLIEAKGLFSMQKTYFDKSMAEKAKMENELSALEKRYQQINDAEAQKIKAEAARQVANLRPQPAPYYPPITPATPPIKSSALEERERDLKLRQNELDRAEAEAERQRQYEAEQAEKQRDHELQMALIQRDTAIAQAKAASLAAEANAKAQEQASSSLDALINGIKGDGTGKN